MSLDSMIGKVKEATGKVLGDKELQAEGIVQQGVAKTKEEIHETSEKLKDGVSSVAHSISEKAKEWVGDAKEKVHDTVIDAKQKLDEEQNN